MQLFPYFCQLILNNSTVLLYTQWKVKDLVGGGKLMLYIKNIDLPIQRMPHTQEHWKALVALGAFSPVKYTSVYV